MAFQTQRTVSCWTTRDVPCRERMAYYADVLTSQVDPMQVLSRSSRSFDATIRAADLDSVTVIHGTGDAHRCARDRNEIACSTGRNFHLILNLASAFKVEQRERHLLRRGEGVFLDSRLGFEIDFDLPFDVIHLKLPEKWMRRWVPDPSGLAGRVLARESSWAGALGAFVAQLSPEQSVSAPIPTRVLVDQIGAMMALWANELGTGVPVISRSEMNLYERIEETIVQRCTDSDLNASDIAAATGISPRTLHRALAAHGKTFYTTLIAQRVLLATRMLESPLLSRLTVAEIGRRAGFTDASHFSRCYRRICARTPSEMRAQNLHPSLTSAR